MNILSKKFAYIYILKLNCSHLVLFSVDIVICRCRGSGVFIANRNKIMVTMVTRNYRNDDTIVRRRISTTVGRSHLGPLPIDLSGPITYLGCASGANTKPKLKYKVTSPKSLLIYLFVIFKLTLNNSRRRRVPDR